MRTRRKKSSNKSVLYRYFKERYGMNVAEGSSYAALPHLIMTIIVPMGGQLADYLRRNEIMTTTTVRKVNILPELVPSILFVTSYSTAVALEVKHSSFLESLTPRLWIRL